MEKLPPTSDAFHLHAARCNYQAKVWLKANIDLPEIPSPTDTGGWISCEDKLQIIWSTIPSIPQSCISLISYGCYKKYRIANCKCYKNNQQCTPLCGCDANECKNPEGELKNDNVICSVDQLFTVIPGVSKKYWCLITYIRKTKTVIALKYIVFYLGRANLNFDI